MGSNKWVNMVLILSFWMIIQSNYHITMWDCKVNPKCLFCKMKVKTIWVMNSNKNKTATLQYSKEYYPMWHVILTSTGVWILFTENA